jgi:hypothetical protein
MKAGDWVDKAWVRQLALEIAEIKAEHRELWLKRNRIGGLAEMSLPPFEAMLAAYQKMLG